MGAGREARPDSVEEALRISAALDARFHDLKGDGVVTSKDGVLATHSHSENWTGPGETPVQFSDDPAFTLVIESAARKSFEGGQVRVASPSALVKEKLRAASDPARRESKRFQDLTDAKSLAEEHPEVEKELTPAETALLKRAL